jgi:hypothetical protein
VGEGQPGNIEPLAEHDGNGFAAHSTVHVPASSRRPRGRWRGLIEQGHPGRPTRCHSQETRCARPSPAPGRAWILLFIHGAFRASTGGVAGFGEWLSSLGFPSGIAWAWAVTLIELLATAARRRQARDPHSLLPGVPAHSAWRWCISRAGSWWGRAECMEYSSADPLW